MKRTDLAPIGRTTPFEDLPEFMTPEEVRQLIGIGRGTCYDLLRRGEIPSVKFGRLIRVPKTALKSNSETETAVLPSSRSRRT